MSFPAILQLTGIRNVGQPSRYQFHDRSPQTLQITLTDGSMIVTGIIISPIIGLNITVNVGSKLKITQPPTCHNGRLFLSPSNCEFIGGTVNDLQQAWRLEKVISPHTDDVSASGIISTIYRRHRTQDY